MAFSICVNPIKPEFGGWYRAGRKPAVSLIRDRLPRRASNLHVIECFLGLLEDVIAKEPWLKVLVRPWIQAP